MTASPAPLLSAATPTEWVATHLARYQARHDDPDEVVDVSARPWVGLGDLLAADAAFLRAQHTQICAEDDATPAAAAKWVVGRFAGKLARSIGWTLAAGGAAVIAEPERVRWRLDPEGCPDRVEFGVLEVAVPPEHAWAGQPGVRVLPDDHAVAAAATDALVRAATPILDAVRPLARVGRNALWAEVADGFGLAVCFDLDLPVEQSALDRLGAALHAPGRPWRQVPEVRVTRADGHAVYLGRRGGCCLYYQCPQTAEPEPVELTDRERAYRERFPHRPDEPNYCTTCSLLDPATSEARQLFWWEQKWAERAG